MWRLIIRVKNLYFATNWQTYRYIPEHSNPLLLSDQKEKTIPWLVKSKSRLQFDINDPDSFQELQNRTRKNGLRSVVQRPYQPMATHILWRYQHRFPVSAGPPSRFESENSRGTRKLRSSHPSRSLWGGIADAFSLFPWIGSWGKVLAHKCNVEYIETYIQARLQYPRPNQIRHCQDVRNYICTRPCYSRQSWH